MRIEKRRAAQWSLDQIEAIPGITTQGVMEELIRCWGQNGWTFVEMADWLNKQKDAEGQPKFLNSVGGPMNGPSCGHILSAIQKSERRKTKGQKPSKVVPKTPPSPKFDYTLYKTAIEEQTKLDKSPAEIFKFMVETHQFPGNYNHIRNFVTRNLRNQPVDVTPQESKEEEVKPGIVVSQPKVVIRPQLTPYKQASVCEPHRTFIMHQLLLQKSPVEIHRLLTVQFGFVGGSSSIRRFIKALRREAQRATEQITQTTTSDDKQQPSV